MNKTEKQLDLLRSKMNAINYALHQMNKRCDKVLESRPQHNDATLNIIEKIRRLSDKTQNDLDRLDTELYYLIEEEDE